MQYMPFRKEPLLQIRISVKVDCSASSNDRAGLGTLAKYFRYSNRKFSALCAFTKLVKFKVKFLKQIIIKTQCVWYDSRTKISSIPFFFYFLYEHLLTASSCDEP